MVAFNETSRPTHRAYARQCVGSSSCAPGKNPSLGVDRNQQYSITALTNGSGTIVERYAYTAYGQPTFFDGSGTVLSASVENNRYTYTGREWDQELHLYHYRARMYDAVSGRFCSRDPIGYLGSKWNVYEYVGSRALIHNDPTGLYGPMPGYGPGWENSLVLGSGCTSRSVRITTIVTPVGFEGNWTDDHSSMILDVIGYPVHSTSFTPAPACPDGWKCCTTVDSTHTTALQFRARVTFQIPMFGYPSPPISPLVDITQTTVTRSLLGVCTRNSCPCPLKSTKNTSSHWDFRWYTVRYDTTPYQLPDELDISHPDFDSHPGTVW